MPMDVESTQDSKGGLGCEKDPINNPKTPVQASSSFKNNHGMAMLETNALTYETSMRKWIWSKEPIGTQIH